MLTAKRTQEVVENKTERLARAVLRKNPAPFPDTPDPDLATRCASAFCDACIPALRIGRPACRTEQYKTIANRGLHRGFTFDRLATVTNWRSEPGAAACQGCS